MIGAQSSKPNISIVQDSLLGAYRMTIGVQKLRKEQFFDIATHVGLTNTEILKKVQHIRKILHEKGKKTQCFTGKGLVSLFLPSDFLYDKKNDADPEEPSVKIYRGVLYEGTFDKAILGASHNSLIQVIHKGYGPDMASSFVDNIQFVSNNWLLISGFSVGIEDCIIPESCSIEKEQKIMDVIQKCYMKAEGIQTTTTNPGIREVRTKAALEEAKDVGLRLAKEALRGDNNFLSTVRSGSKGDFFNIAQITGLLGQQNLVGQRVKPVMNNGKRTLPHYPFEGLTVRDKYESRGFVDSSFIKGLNPRQFYFHAMSGREGVCDTALNTAKTGYTQRRMVKLMEDMKVAYDGSVRDTNGRMYQAAYGETGVDPTCTVKVGEQQEVCDVSRIVAKMNMEINVKRQIISKASQSKPSSKSIRPRVSKFMKTRVKG